jgi:hypothetical protein
MPKRRKRFPQYEQYHPHTPKTASVDPDQAPYLDPHASLPGWPGYRTRPGRSGYDYLDNQFEWGHMLGVLLRMLFTGKLRTKNPFYQILMGFCGLVYSFPLLIGLAGFIGGAYPLSVANLIIFLVLLVWSAPGIALLVNLYLSLFSR